MSRGWCGLLLFYGYGFLEYSKIIIALANCYRFWLILWQFLNFGDSFLFCYPPFGYSLFSIFFAAESVDSIRFENNFE